MKFFLRLISLPDSTHQKFERLEKAILCSSGDDGMKWDSKIWWWEALPQIVSQKLPQMPILRSFHLNRSSLSGINEENGNDFKFDERVDDAIHRTTSSPHGTMIWMRFRPFGLLNVPRSWNTWEASFKITANKLRWMKNATFSVSVKNLPWTSQRSPLCSSIERTIFRLNLLERQAQIALFTRLSNCSQH